MHIDQAKRWYALYTQPSHEKRVAEHLAIRNVELFLPVYRSLRRWNNGCRVVLERPLFPGYVFVHIPPSDRLRVLEPSGVLSIIGTRGGPTPLPAEEIERLRTGLPLLKAEPCPAFAVGDPVKICRGPLEGLTGVLARYKNSLRVIITLNLILKSVAVELPLTDIQPFHLSPQTASAGAAAAAAARCAN